MEGGAGGPWEGELDLSAGRWEVFQCGGPNLRVSKPGVGLEEAGEL